MNYISKIEIGDQIYALKAAADVDGNPIETTYLKKEEMDTTYATVEYVDNMVGDINAILETI